MLSISINNPINKKFNIIYDVTQSLRLTNNIIRDLYTFYSSHNLPIVSFSKKEIEMITIWWESNNIKEFVQDYPVEEVTNKCVDIVNCCLKFIGVIPRSLKKSNCIGKEKYMLKLVQKESNNGKEEPQIRINIYVKEK